MAISEIRVCFCLIAVLVILIGLYAIRRESKKYADLVILLQHNTVNNKNLICSAIKELFFWVSHW